MKKKPLVIRPHHQTWEEKEVVVVKREHWVTAVAALPSTDLVASGMSKLFYVDRDMCVSALRARSCVCVTCFTKHSPLSYIKKIMRIWAKIHGL